jgi:lysine 6-dehydrogenase
MVADASATSAQRLGEEFGIPWVQVDATDVEAVAAILEAHDCLVSAVPYLFGEELAAAAVAGGCHYFDFGGNPTIVKKQLLLDEAARTAGVAVVPDCGLAPGFANVLAAGLIAAAPDTVDDVQIRVGVLPQDPAGILQYQLAFYAGGLINEYAEPCEILQDGVVATVEPLTRFEQIDWGAHGTLEAFATAGGTSSMCQEYAGRVTNLEYKTLRFPGHGRVFAAMREVGLFETNTGNVGGVQVAPRAVLLDLLTKHLPSGGADLTLVSVAATGPGFAAELRIEDVADGTFSSLARTTAFPTTALCDLVVRGVVDFRGAAAMHTVAPSDEVVAELEPVGITIENR